MGYTMRLIWQIDCWNRYLRLPEIVMRRVDWIGEMSSRRDEGLLYHDELAVLSGLSNFLQIAAGFFSCV